jgi:hypothetical protein
MTRILGQSLNYAQGRLNSLGNGSDQFLELLGRLDYPRSGRDGETGKIKNDQSGAVGGSSGRNGHHKDEVWGAKEQ